jgi:hypothetical protein
MCGLVCPSRPSEREGKGYCVKGGWREGEERVKERVKERVRRSVNPIPNPEAIMATPYTGSFIAASSNSRSSHGQVHPFTKWDKVRCYVL